MRISVATDDLDLVGPPEPSLDDDRSIARNARIRPDRDGARDRNASGARSTGAGRGMRRDQGAGIAALQLDRARSVASSLDIRGARVDEALDALDRYLDDAALAGLDKVTVIHGLGTGALRDAVRARAGAHPLVSSFRGGERGEGGDGATVVSLA